MINPHEKGQINVFTKWNASIKWDLKTYSLNKQWKQRNCDMKYIGNEKCLKSPTEKTKLVICVSVQNGNTFQIDGSCSG